MCIVFEVRAHGGQQCSSSMLLQLAFNTLTMACCRTPLPWHTSALLLLVCALLQERVARTAKCLWRYDSARDWPPLAAINVVRADRSCVRMTVRPAAIVPRVVSQLQALGWPPLPTQPAAAPAAAAPAVQEQERQLQAAAHQLTDGESFSARVQQVAWLRDACPASPQKQRSQPAALEAAAGAADASTSTADGGSGGCTAEGGVTSPREPRERLAQLRPLGEGSPGGSPVRGNARQLPDYSGLR